MMPKVVVCPHLDKDEKCSIYEDRYSCCRSYPNLTTPSAFCFNTDRCTQICETCEDKCCKHIFVDGSISDVAEAVKQALSIPCSTCHQLCLQKVLEQEYSESEPNGHTS